MMRITFSGNSLNEIKVKMGSFLLECQSQNAHTQLSYTANLPEPKAKGRPKMSIEEHLAKSDKVEQKEAKPSKAVTMETYEELKSVFLEYHEAFGDQESKALLSLYGAEKLSELDKRSYHKFIRVCREKLNH